MERGFLLMPGACPGKEKATSGACGLLNRAARAVVGVDGVLVWGYTGGRTHRGQGLPYNRRMCVLWESKTHSTLTGSGAYEVDEAGSPFQSAPPKGQSRRDMRNTAYPNNLDDTGLDMRTCMLVGRRR